MFLLLQMWVDYRVIRPNNVTYNHKFFLDNSHDEAFDNHVVFDQELLDWPFLNLKKIHIILFNNKKK